MTPFVAELIGTAMIITLGNGVVANVILDKTKGNGGGLIAITIGWSMAVFVGVYMTAAASGAHLNPAVTLALTMQGKLAWNMVPLYMSAQLLGAMLGSGIVWLMYRNHLDTTSDAATCLAVFSTSPAINNPLQNFLTEMLATMVFLVGVLCITSAEHSLGALNALPVALLVLAIGLSLGGPTGYAINPARDLGPRIMHALLPIQGKGGSDWQYAWVPVAGPLVGAAIAAWLYSSCLS
ncbi:MAG: aquaporin family protein [Chitinophagaceae bacterium]|nr:aquaporin family protein [Chitinophagaceae bacterium]